MNTIIGKNGDIKDLFTIMGGWTTQFNIDGIKVGGTVDILPKDPRLEWQIGVLNGIKNKTILELGALEGAHSKMMIENGAKEVIAIEGLSDCFLRLLIVKEAFNLVNLKPIFADFNEYIKNYKGQNFDIISAAGVLYHQQNPVELIFNMAKITDNVIVWSQVADVERPSLIEEEIIYEGVSYKGKINDYGGTRLTSESFMGGLNNTAFWLYPEDMIRAFKNAGFINITEKKLPPNINGESLFFVASK